MVARPGDASKEVSKGLNVLRRFLEQEAGRITAEAGVSTSAAIKGDALLLAFYKASRQLSKLKSSLLEQPDASSDAQSPGRRSVLGEEYRKAQWALSRAQAAAEDKYQALMAQLSSAGTTGDAHQEQALKLIESCNHATGVALAAITALTNAAEKMDTSPATAMKATTTISPSTTTDGGHRSALASTCQRSSSGGRTTTRERRQTLPSRAVEPGARAERKLPRTHSDRTIVQCAGAAPEGAMGAAVGGASQLGLVHRSNSERGFQSFSQNAPQSISSSSCLPRAAVKAGDGVVGSSTRDQTRTLMADTVFSLAPSAAAAAPSERSSSAFPARRSSSILTAHAVESSQTISSSDGTNRSVSASAATTRSTVSCRPTLGLSPVTRGGKNWRQSLAVAASDRRVKSRAAAAAAAAAAAQPLSAACPSTTDPGADMETGHSAQSHQGERRNGKLSPEEQQAASRWESETANARASSSLCRRWLDVTNGIHGNGRPAAAVTRIPGGSTRSRTAARRTDRHTTAAQWMEQFDEADAASGAGVVLSGRSTRSQVEPRTESPALHSAAASEGSSEHQLAVAASGARAAHGEEVAHASVSDAALAALAAMGVSSPPPPPRGAALARRRSLGESGSSERWAAGAGGEPGRYGLYLTAAETATVAELFLSGASRTNPSPDDGICVYDTRAGGTRNQGSPGVSVSSDEATALRIAKQEQEAQACEDALLALRLAALEDASHEEREARTRRRAARRAARRRDSGSPQLRLDPAIAAAFAAEGSAVSEAVRALQFQDIDENDFETLLALDEGGGAGGGCCDGQRGLSEEAMGAALQPATASGVRLTETCAICMCDYELDEELAILPCLHAFHSGCIRKWLLIRNLCPADMQPVVADASSTQEESADGRGEH